MSAPKTGFLPRRSSGGPSSQAGKQLQRLSFAKGKNTKTLRLRRSRPFVPASGPTHQINKRRGSVLLGRFKATWTPEQDPRTTAAYCSTCCTEVDIPLCSSIAMVLSSHQMGYELYKKYKTQQVSTDYYQHTCNLSVHIPESLDSSWVEVTPSCSLHRCLKLIRPKKCVFPNCLKT